MTAPIDFAEAIDRLRTTIPADMLDGLRSVTVEGRCFTRGQPGYTVILEPDRRPPDSAYVYAPPPPPAVTCACGEPAVVHRLCRRCYDATRRRKPLCSSCGRNQAYSRGLCRACEPKGGQP